MNRLLINMKNKVDIINGAIDQCKRLMNNETIELNGIHKIKLTRGNVSDVSIQDRINELQVEKQELLIRIDRFN
jgi:hypothetical protein